MQFWKNLFRWFILGFTIFFISANIHQNWRSLQETELTKFVWLMFLVSLFFNLLAHTFSAWVWTWILNLFSTKLTGVKAIYVYLITNIHKYLPGNIWHFLGRVKALQEQGDTLATATVAVVIEPLILAIAGLLISLISATFGVIKINFSPLFIILQLLAIILVFTIIHPQIINPILKKIAKNKGSKEATKLIKYPLVPLGGGFVYLLLRGCGFMTLLIPFIPLDLSLIPQIITAFNFAWFLGLIVPGAPGGLGIFEATIIAILDVTVFPRGIILIAVALFRLSSIIAELITAYGAFLLQQKVRI